MVAIYTGAERDGRHSTFVKSLQTDFMRHTNPGEIGKKCTPASFLVFSAYIFAGRRLRIIGKEALFGRDG
jgi:hypothetical protein